MNEIDRHGDGDHFDGLTGDVEHAAGKDLDEIGIADGDRERGVLDQIEILAGQRRHDHAHRLRNDDEPKHRARSQAERLRRLGLAVRHGQNAGAHHFGDEGRGIDRERQQERREFRQDFDAAHDVEAAHLRKAERQRRTARANTTSGRPTIRPSDRPKECASACRCAPDGGAPTAAARGSPRPRRSATSDMTKARARIPAAAETVRDC